MTTAIQKTSEENPRYIAGADCDGKTISVCVMDRLTKEFVYTSTLPVLSKEDAQAKFKAQCEEIAKYYKPVTYQLEKNGWLY